MAPRCGRCEQGNRLIAHVPFGHWKTTTLIAALRHDGITAPFVFDGPINGEKFGAYVGQILVPTRKRATSSSWTISPPTKSPASAKRSKPPPKDGFCLPTAPIWTPSDRCSPRSKTRCKFACRRTVDALWNAVGVAIDDVYAHRMPQLLPERRLWIRVKGMRSSRPSASPGSCTPGTGV